MSRWAPAARERLEAAALDLFLENGFEATTVAQIAERADLNRATFFRHFADKREVLFAGEDVLSSLFADGIRGAPSGASVDGCLQAGLEAVGSVMTPQRRSTAHRRIRVVAANSDLHERGQLKRVRITASVAEALQARGADPVTARLAAELGLLVFTVAFERWLQVDADRPFGPFARSALHDVRSKADDLDRPLPSAADTRRAEP